MKEKKSINTRLAFLLLVVAILCGIASVVFVKPPLPDNLGQFCPPAEELEYVAVSAKGERTGRGVTRDEAEIASFHAMADAIAMEERQESYIGVDYEGTLYTIEMKRADGVYEVMLDTAGTVHHANGKYFIAAGQDTAAFYAWLERMIP